MSVCIRGPEGILYEKGFGYRSIEHRKPVDADTVFGIASMSKSMTALACCILQAEGKMSLEDPVVKYFPDFHIPARRTSASRCGPWPCTAPVCPPWSPWSGPLP